MPRDQLSQSGSDESDAASVEDPGDEIDQDIENGGSGQEEHIGKRGDTSAHIPALKS